MAEIVRNALVLGGSAALLAGLGQHARVRPYLPFLALVGVVGALGLGALHPTWALASLLADAPWLGALALAAWSLHAGTGWLRVGAWPLVVLVAALLGDRFVALGLALGEPDPARRARLVLAASGASLVGPLGSAAGLSLGWGGMEVALLGLLAASVGYTRAGPPPERVAPRFAAIELVLPLTAALGVWLATLGGALEFAAQGIEQLPLLFPRAHGVLLASAGALAGVLGDEGFLGLGVAGVLDRAGALHDDLARQRLLAGLALGGGLPLLVLTRSSLRVGVPLWLLQLLILGGWAWLS